MRYMVNNSHPKNQKITSDTQRKTPAKAMNYTNKVSPQTKQVKTASSKTRNPWLKKFYNLPISRKQLIALIFSQLVSILGIGIGGTLIITQGLRNQLLEQAKSEVAVSDINYNIKINQMGLGFRGQSDNDAIIRAAILNDSNRALNGNLRNSVKQILQNEIKARNIEYATLVGKDLKIIANANANRAGEIFNPNNLVNLVFKNPQQIKASAIVSASELSKESPPLPEGISDRDALIRYTVTPVRNPQTQEVVGALISGDIVNGKDEIVKKTLQSFDGGYSAIYLNQPTGGFELVTSLQNNLQGNIDRATPNVPLPPQSKLLEAAAKAQGKTITQRIQVEGINYTVAAKAVPDRIIEQPDGEKLVYSEQPPAILVRGTPETALNSLLTESLIQQALTVLIALLVVGVWAVILRRGMIRPIENLQETALKFANGDRASRADVFATDEIGDLAVSFNTMADKISEEARRQEIEAKVALQLTQITSRIRETLDIETILKTLVTTSQEALRVNRVVFYRLNDSQGEIIAESVDYTLNAVLGEKVNDPYQVAEYPDEYEFGSIKAVENIQDLRLNQSYLEQLNELDVKAFLLAPVFVNDKLYGLFAAHATTGMRSWEEIEINLFRQIAIQTGYALEQAELLQQVQHKRQTAESSSEEEKQQKEQLQMQLMELLGNIEGAANGDLTVRADVIEGEIGTVADFFNSIIESLREIVTEVKTSASQVNDSLGANESAIAKLAQEAKTQAAEIDRTLNAVDTMTSSMKTVAQNAREAAVVANAANTATQSGAAMDLTVENIIHLRETVGDTAKKVKRLGESTQEISRVVALINQISMQTNLLAINAGIEAARAGEEGQGFAVVAEEVGELAARSASATKEIEQVVENIQRETSELVESMEIGVSQVVEGTRVVEGAKYSLNEILQVSRQIDSLVKSISEATASQVQTSQEVSQLMKNIADISQRTTVSSEEVSHSLQKTVEISQRLQNSVGAFTVSS